jgi:3-deoxy-D-manno-octulosonic-acid transferase
VQDNEKLVSIGSAAENTEIMGNLKFDIKKPDVSSLNFNKNPQDKIILAGSTHTGEDEIILEAFNSLKTKFGNLKLIIAPRHPERNSHVFELMQKTGLACGKRSDGATFDNNELILLDTMGELGKFYSVCDIAFIAGSFSKTGGHNPLEATIFQKPAISGPCVHNFKDIYAILTSTNAGKIVKNGDELKFYIEKLLSDNDFYTKAGSDCEKVFDDNKGALAFVLNVIKGLV